MCYNFDRNICEINLVEILQRKGHVGYIVIAVVNVWPVFNFLGLGVQSRALLGT
jgi:hypothetical protein